MPVTQMLEGRTKILSRRCLSLILPLAASSISLALLHQAIPTLLRPMFGSIPLDLQYPLALRYCSIFSILANVLLPEEQPHESTLAFAMGIGVSLAALFARQAAKLSSPAGPLHGSLWAMMGLLVVPTIYGSLLWNRLISGELRNASPSRPHSPWSTRVLNIGITIGFITSTSKGQRLLVSKFVSQFGEDSITKGLVLASVVLLCYGYNCQNRRTSSRPSPLLVLHATLVLLSLLSVLRPIRFPIFYSKANIRILNSTSSVTGQIVVGDNLAGGYRFLRCDHSLLGGRWIKERENGGLLFGDSIFSAFVLQEVGRLAGREERMDSEVPEAEIIGLGAGIAADALIRHGYKVRVIELDPAVYDAARTYLNLAESHKVVLEDALKVVRERSQRMRVEGTKDIDLSDLVIHDCFTGGSVPGELFTSAFWRQLAMSIKPSGILVVNFAGVINNNGPHAIFRTLYDAFPQCRVFHDNFSSRNAEDSHHLANVVFVCAMSHSPLLSFRPAVADDFLRSPLRMHVLTRYLENELLPDSFWENDADTARHSESITGLSSSSLQLQRRVGMAVLEQWQVDSALATWKAMRGIMPVEAWMAY